MKKLSIVLIVLIMVLAISATAESASLPTEPCQDHELVDTVTNIDGILLEVWLRHMYDGDYYTVETTNNGMWTSLFIDFASKWEYNPESHILVKHNEDGTSDFIVVSQLVLPEEPLDGWYLQKCIFIDDILYFVIEDHFDGEVWMRIIDGDYYFNGIEYFAIAIGPWTWNDDSQVLTIVPEENTTVEYYYRNQDGIIIIGNTVELKAGEQFILAPAQAISGFVQL